jgi:hypothetical protein
VLGKMRCCVVYIAINNFATNHRGQDVTSLRKVFVHYVDVTNVNKGKFMNFMVRMIDAYSVIIANVRRVRVLTNSNATMGFFDV